MTEIKLHTYGEKLIVSEKVTLSSGNVNSAELHVMLDEAWAAYPNISATFETKEYTEPVEKLMLPKSSREYVCVIPPEVLQEQGILEIGIIGISNDGEMVKTSSIAKYNIVRGASHSTITLKPSMDLYQQYLASMDASVAPLFEAYRRDIDGLYTAMIDEIRTQHSNFQEAMIELTQPNVLWTNPGSAVDQEVAAKTYSIPNLRNYNHFLVIFYEDTSSYGNNDQYIATQKLVSPICQKGTTYTIEFVDVYSHSGASTDSRTFSLSDTELQISDMKPGYVYNNCKLIPYQIIGWV